MLKRGLQKEAEEEWQYEGMQCLPAHGFQVEERLKQPQAPALPRPGRLHAVLTERAQARQKLFANGELQTIRLKI